MNKINHLFLVLFFSLWSVMTAFTQNLLEVKYEQTIKQFTAVTQSATLYYKDGKSMYIHSKGKKGNVMKNLDGSDWNEDLNTPFMTWYQDSIGAIVFKDYTNKVLKFRDFYEAKAYISQEDFPTFKWTVTREQKIVLGYTCYKAATQFRGRDYIAWFTMDIPVQAGPWKFWGLPGLILEATDNTNQI